MGSFSQIGMYSPANTQQVGQTSSAGTSEVGTKVNLEQVEKSQDKLKFALVDSGHGGGMTAAYLKGEVRQLGSYFCLPIGDKKPAVAAAYTAAMALWPMIMPLANGDGNDDGKVAENVIIACNSASVRKENAIKLMAQYCNAVQANSQEVQSTPQSIKDGINKLAAAVTDAHQDTSIDAFKKYFEEHVHEIVSKTAEAGASKAVELLAGRDVSEDPLLVRVDSTNGTAGTKAYPTKMLEALIKNAEEEQSLNNVRLLHETETTVNGDTITHHVISLTLNNEQRSIVIEGRGNQPWVNAIEASASEAFKEELVERSNKNSANALEGATNSLGEGRKDAAGILNKLQKNGNKPALTMLCCTHYPAMKTALADSYGNNCTFINQAEIVENIVSDIQKKKQDDGPLHLSLTVGSMNYGGAAGEIRPSIADGNKTAETLGRVLEQTMQDRYSHLDRQLGSVKVFSQGERRGVTQNAIEAYEHGNSYQRDFEMLHTLLVTNDADIERFYKDQNLKKNDTYTIEGEKPPFVFAPNETRKDPIQPRTEKLSESANELYNKMEPTLAQNLSDLAVLMTLGEERGLDKIAPLNDQGAQMKAAIAHLMSVVSKNNEKEEADKELVGILTGFTVVNTETGERIGGENDGPPGAAIMGKTLVDQGTPVVFITDKSAEASLLSALVAAKLVTLNDQSANKDYKTLELSDVTLIKGVNVEVSDTIVPETNAKPLPTDDVAKRRQEIDAYHKQHRDAVIDTVKVLASLNVGTMISIERPDTSQLDGAIYSMAGSNVLPFNADMSPTLGFLDEQTRQAHGLADYRPFTIGIGDGGNELGTGGIQSMTAEGRDHRLTSFVNNGSVIAANPDHSTDVMLLSSVSNNAGVAISMALQAARGENELEEQLKNTISDYNDIITGLFKKGMSIDGVQKTNVMAVDGRALGSPEDAGTRSLSDEKHTHNDMFNKFKNVLLGRQ